MSRPICVHCGKAYGRRWTTDEVVRREPGQPFPPYRGNGIVVKEMTMTDTATVAYRSIWDGETWVMPYKPFCMLRCALDYARKAWRQGVGAKPD